jgi:hypothetical protein
MNAERTRLKDLAWKKWGPYVADRQWGTVREDYSANGDAWDYTTFNMARSKAYRWGEEGIAGICDDQQLMCFAMAFWNKKDPFIKEIYYGMSGPQGNHGEDVKELYYYLDSTPTHSYMKMLYKYPQAAFPYDEILEETKKRTRNDPEYELIDTGIFDENKYFDIFIEYAKAAPEDILIKITIHNRADADAALNVLPTLWMRNTWSFTDTKIKPLLFEKEPAAIAVKCESAGEYSLHCEGDPEIIFCDNNTNNELLYSAKNETGYCKDGVNNYIIHKATTVNPYKEGTKGAANYDIVVKGGDTYTIRLRLTKGEHEQPFKDFENILAARLQDANDFYAEIQHDIKNEDAKLVQRQALGSILWNKQFYNYNVQQWLSGDPGQPRPPVERLMGRNHTWKHMNCMDIISMPDKWEYPWFAAWDLAFHCITLSMVDIDFAKQQLELLTKEQYMHPNGQLPAYEWAFEDANPPVHAWAAWRVYREEAHQNGGKTDIAFLESIFHKLLLTFTWWVNRKDESGNNIFEGGFLGLDNIEVFDRSKQLPMGGYIEQADGTSWMAMFALNMLHIALELSRYNKVYIDLANKFFEHFLYIAGALEYLGENGEGLWDDEDGFFYDQVQLPTGKTFRLKVRSMVGLTPLFAVEIIDSTILKELPEFEERMQWFLEHRPDLASLVSRFKETNENEKILLSLVRADRMKHVLYRMLDETEFLSDHGVRALSKYHLEHPYELTIEKETFCSKYTPGESDNAMFGGNSNWRGPVWMPVNALIIESLLRFHTYYGEDFKVECPTGSGKYLPLRLIANELIRRLERIYLKDHSDRRVVFGQQEKMQTDAYFKDNILFFEYFHGETGKGLGASHQTGWTGIMAKFLGYRF